MKTVIKKLLAAVGLKVINTKYQLRAFLDGYHVLFLSFEHVVDHYISKRNPVTPFYFIQIGAFDGVMHDPLRKYIVRYEWNGILVEPQPEPFNKLQELYANCDRINLLNCVISDSRGDKIIYVVDEDAGALPDWIRGSASFDRKNLSKYSASLPALGNAIKELRVKSITMNDLISIHGNKPLDLLQIDAEGYDGELIKMFPFETLKPQIIHFESKNLSRNQLQEVVDILVRKGYDVAFDGGMQKAEDMIAVLRQPEIFSNNA